MVVVLRVVVVGLGVVVVVCKFIQKMMMRLWYFDGMEFLFVDQDVGMENGGYKYWLLLWMGGSFLIFVLKLRCVWYFL